MNNLMILLIAISLGLANGAQATEEQLSFGFHGPSNAFQSDLQSWIEAIRNGMPPKGKDNLLWAQRHNPNLKIDVSDSFFGRKQISMTNSIVLYLSQNVEVILTADHHMLFKYDMGSNASQLESKKIVDMITSKVNLVEIPEGAAENQRLSPVFHVLSDRNSKDQAGYRESWKCFRVENYDANFAAGLLEVLSKVAETNSVENRVAENRRAKQNKQELEEQKRTLAQKQEEAQLQAELRRKELEAEARRQNQVLVSEFSGLVSIHEARSGALFTVSSGHWERPDHWFMVVVSDPANAEESMQLMRFEEGKAKLDNNKSIFKSDWFQKELMLDALPTAPFDRIIVVEKTEGGEPRRYRALSIYGAYRTHPKTWGKEGIVVVTSTGEKFDLASDLAELKGWKTKAFAVKVGESPKDALERFNRTGSKSALDVTIPIDESKLGKWTLPLLIKSPVTEASQINTASCRQLF